MLICGAKDEFQYFAEYWQSHFSRSLNLLPSVAQFCCCCCCSTNQHTLNFATFRQHKLSLLPLQRNPSPQNCSETQGFVLTRCSLRSAIFYCWHPHNPVRPWLPRNKVRHSSFLHQHGQFLVPVFHIYGSIFSA